LVEDKRRELDGLRKFINAQVEAHQDYKVLLRRVEGMTQGLLTMRAIDKLRRLVDEGKVIPDYVKPGRRCAISNCTPSRRT
jgi:hypothetical protein